MTPLQLFVRFVVASGLSLLLFTFFWSFRSRIVPVGKESWYAYRYFWRIDRGWTWCRWPSWGLTVFVEVVFRNRIGCKFRVGPVLVWWWATSLVERVKFYPPTTGTPTMFGQPVGRPISFDPNTVKLEDFQSRKGVMQAHAQQEVASRPLTSPPSTSSLAP